LIPKLAGVREDRRVSGGLSKELDYTRITHPVSYPAPASNRIPETEADNQLLTGPPLKTRLIAGFFVFDLRNLTSC